MRRTPDRSLTLCAEATRPAIAVSAMSDQLSSDCDKKRERSEAWADARVAASSVHACVHALFQHDQAVKSTIVIMAVDGDQASERASAVNSSSIH